MDPVFTIDLRNDLDNEETLHFYMISKHGLSKTEPLLNKHWKKMSAICFQNIAQILPDDEVISKVRRLLNERLDRKLTIDHVREAIFTNMLQLT
jgi:hypothetical protein